MTTVTHDGLNVNDLCALGGEFDDLRGELPGAVCLARRYLQIRDREGHIGPLIANPAQIAFERTRKRQNIILKARQMGMTTWIAARFFLKTITTPGAMTVQVAHTQGAAESIFRMVQRFWENLEEALRKGPLKRSRANKHQMAFPALDSEFRVLTAADANCGRGLTVQYMHLSEVSRWPGNAAETLAGLRAALVPSGEIVLESTPNGACGCFYEEWLQAEEKDMARHFFPWWLEPAYVSAPVTDLRDDEQELVEKHGLTAAQIGYRRGLEASYHGMRPQEFAEDPELCFLTTGDCCFDLDSLEARLKLVEDAPETRRGGTYHAWFPPAEDKEYIVAVDPAGGGPNGDYTAMQVIERGTGLQCAELQQRLRPLQIAQRAAQIARDYSACGRPALVVVERNNHGYAVLGHLNQVEHYENVYAHKSGADGFLTNSANKPEIIANMNALLVDRPELFRSKRLLEECRTFVNLPGGGQGASNGAHDDMVMAMAIAQAVRNETLTDGKGRLRAA